jgi:uncharacterized protein involved in exopolysaccharide biosynthesis
VPAQAIWDGNDGISLVGFGTTVLRRRRIVAQWSLIGGAVAAITVLFTAAKYDSTASFMPQQTDMSRSGVASLAGQFGISLASVDQTVSPDFYSALLKSRVLLSRIATDSFVVPELENRRIAFVDLFDVPQGSQARRVEDGVKLLDDIVTTSVVKTTGMVRLSVVTKWPSVSYTMVQSLLTGVDEFNRRTRQGQATSERVFIESRLTAATTDLRDAEDRMERFLVANRQYAASPDLTFQHDRLQRDITVRQQVVSTLTQAYEEVRIREVRDTPLITVLEPPTVPATPQSRKRLLRLLFGLVSGAMIGLVVALTSASVKRRDAAGDPEVRDLIATLHEIRDRLPMRNR